jgi:hypothetical protein
MPNDLPAEFDEEPGVVEENSFWGLPRYAELSWESVEAVSFVERMEVVEKSWIELPCYLSFRTVSVTEGKKAKYKAAIEKWLSQPVHTLDEVQKLYGKLLHIIISSTYTSKIGNTWSVMQGGSAY